MEPTNASSLMSREVVEKNTVAYYRTAGGTRPDVRLVEIDGRQAVVKDYRRSDFLFRLIVGPILIRQEYNALRHLVGIQGIPQLIARLDRHSIAIEHVQRTELRDVPPGEVGNEFYDELRQVIRAMHERGVVHCDLRSRGNIIVRDDGKPYIVDFAAAIVRGRGLNPFMNWLFRLFTLADMNAVLVAKKRFSPHLLTDDEERELAKRLPFERPAKMIGESVRWLTRALLTRPGRPSR